MEKTAAETVRSLQVDILRRAIEKNAGFWSGFKKALKPKRMGAAAGTAFAEGAATAAVSAMGVGVAKGFSSLVDRVRKPKAFSAMVSANPSLKKMDQTNVQRTFNTLYALNPQLAREPLTAGSFVGQSVQRADIGGTAGSYVPIDTAQNLQRGNKSSRPILEAFSSSRAKMPKKLTKAEKWDAVQKSKKYDEYKAQHKASR